MGIFLGEIDFLSIGIIGAIEIVLIGAVYYFYTEWSDLTQKYPELKIHQAAKRGQRPPVIDMVDLSGAHRQFSGVKEKSQSVSFKNKDYGVIFDPRLVNVVPKDHYSDNVPVYTYFTTLYFPVDTVGSVAVVQCMERIRKEYPQLDFIHDDFTIMGLLATPSEDLKYDIPNIMKAYSETVTNGEPQTISPDEFSNLIQDIQIQMRSWGMKSGFYSIADAIKAIPMATTGLDVQEIIQLAKLEYANDHLRGDFDKWFPILAVCAIMGVLAMAYMVLSSGNH